MSSGNVVAEETTHVCISIDGRNVSARRGETVLEAARREGIEIPSLCGDPRLKPTGRCGLCVVEIKGLEGLRSACETAIAEGLEINTKGAEIAERRKSILDELLSDHNAYCEPPCRYACPAGIDIPGYLRAIAEGDDSKAVRIVKERLPLPRIIGRVCPRPCESACRRPQVDGEPVAICQLKRFAGDRAALDEAAAEELPHTTGRRIAVVGSGPSGLSAAYFLAKAGHSVKILETNGKPGGMLLTALPAYRLPKDVVQEEIDDILKLGVDLEVNSRLGTDYTVVDLRARFDAVYLAVGAAQASYGGIYGTDGHGVYTALDFLDKANEETWTEKLGKTVVFGGGFTAVDAARSAVRLGASEVTLVYRRTREEMPATGQEVDEAEREGVSFMLLTSPSSIERADGKLAGVVCHEMELGEPDESGRRSPVQVENSDFLLEADTVILAIGQKVDSAGLDDDLEKNRNGTITADKRTLTTSMEGVFAGGDCRIGPSTVVEAIADGRRAALMIDAYLRGEDPEERLRDPLNGLVRERPEFFPIGADPASRSNRHLMPELRHDQRLDFSEVELGYTEEQARAEAARCLNCVCHAAGDCELRRLSIRYGAGTEEFKGGGSQQVFGDNKILSLDRKRCVGCQNCARICDEVQDIAVYGLDKEGYPILRASEYAEAGCEFCGQCLSACPTGALRNLTDKGVVRSDLRKKTRTVCPYCGCGCTIDLLVEGNTVVGIDSPVGEGVNGGNLCAKGRFGFAFINHPARLGTPLVRKNGELSPASWDEAIARAAEGIKRAIEAHGPDAAGGLASARCTNEENYLFQKFMRAAVGTNNVDHCARL